MGAQRAQRLTTLCAATDAALPPGFSLHLVRRRWDLHGHHSGYDPLSEHMRSASRFRTTWTDFSFFQRVLLTLPHQTLRFGKSLLLGRWAGAKGIVVEAGQRLAWARTPPDAIHLLAVDEMLGALASMRRLFPSVLMLGTIHLPPSIWRSHPRHEWESLRHLNVLVALSSEQKEFFARELPGLRTIFVPHGIDTEFFRPSPSGPAAAPRVVFAGTMLRDFEALARCVATVIAADCSICFDLVIPTESRSPEITALAEGAPRRVVLHNRIPAEALRDLYQRAQVALVPLRDCAANNAILEGLACGLPLIVSDVGGTRDYVSEDCAVLISPGESHLFAERLLDLVPDATRRTRMGHRARERAETFSWERVVRGMQEVYSRLYASRVA